MKLFHNSQSITTMTGLVVAKEKGLALVGSNCQFPGFSTGLNCCHRTAAGFSEKWWEITTQTLWSESHCTLFWQLVWYSNPSGNWTAILIGIPMLSFCYQVSFPTSSSMSKQEYLLSIPFFFWMRTQHTQGVPLLLGWVYNLTTVNTSSRATSHSCVSYDHNI